MDKNKMANPTGIGGFRKGQVANPKGRPPGTPNKVTMALREQILGALDRLGGINYLVKLGEREPAAFVSLLGKVLPSTIQGAEDDGKMGLRVVFERRIVHPNGHRDIEIVGEGKSEPDRGARLVPAPDGVLIPQTGAHAPESQDLSLDPGYQELNGSIPNCGGAGSSQHDRDKPEIEQWNPRDRW